MFVLQHLEEAGEESSRFDMLVPTIVYPKTSSEHTMNAEQLSRIVSISHLTVNLLFRGSSLP